MTILRMAGERRFSSRRCVYNRGHIASGAAVVGLSALAILVPTTGGAETFRIQPTFGISETLTNNVNLAPSGSAQGDLVTQLTPGITINEVGARVSLTGNVSVPILLYAKTGAQNNTSYVQANLLGNAEVIEKFFYVEAAVDAAPQYFTPFGAQPQGLANATQNRYQIADYRVSAYIKGGHSGDIEYLVRNDSIWTTLNSTPLAVNNSYTNQTLATVGKQAPQLGWLFEYDRTSVKFSSQPPLLTELGRLRLSHSPDPQVTLSVSGGYENNDYTFTHSSDAIYGVGARWFPTERTKVEASWEHRFFGASYLFDFSHRTPLSVWLANASRNITSYPQQVGSLQAGVAVSSLLNQLFLSASPGPGAAPGGGRPVHQQPWFADDAFQPGQSLYSADHAANLRLCFGGLARRAQQHFFDRLLLAAAAHHCRRQRYPRVHCWFQRQYAGRRQHRLDTRANAVAYACDERHHQSYREQPSGVLARIPRYDTPGICDDGTVHGTIAEHVGQWGHPVSGAARGSGGRQWV